MPDDLAGRDAITAGLVGATMLGRTATLDDVGDVAAFAASDKARSMNRDCHQRHLRGGRRPVARHERPDPCWSDRPSITHTSPNPTTRRGRMDGRVGGLRWYRLISGS